MTSAVRCKFYKCQCFLTNNYFLKKYNLHVNFSGKDSFLSEYDQILRKAGCTTEDELKTVLEELEVESSRRQRHDENKRKRTEENKNFYKPLHPEVYVLKDEYFTPSFLNIVNSCRTGQPDFENCKTEYKNIYRFHVFTKEFCDEFIEELVHFEASEFDKGRPNTMNKYGIMLDEMGMNECFLNPLRENYLAPLAQHLFPEWCGKSLDSHKSFIVTYKIGEDEDLDFHFDNAEVTMNICLGRQFENGELYFGNMADESFNSHNYATFESVPTYGIFHRGRHYHGSMPITSGERYNLVVWLRSSSIRNNLCPMCQRKPILLEGYEMAEGFTQPEKETV